MMMYDVWWLVSISLKNCSYIVLKLLFFLSKNLVLVKLERKKNKFIGEIVSIL